MDIWNNKYDVIVIDPPWDIGKIIRKVRPKQGPTLDYPTMSIGEIASLEIKKIATDDCVLFLWTINQYLGTAIDLVSFWGFRFHLLITWDKQNGMCLFGFHRRTEFVLVGFKGKIEMYPHRKAMPTIITESSWGKHSVKPDIFYQWAETFGDKKVDLFARRQRPGWDCWGNEVE